MTLVIRPLTRKQTANMPKFNNVDKHLGEPFLERLERIGKDAIDKAGEVYDIILDTKNKVNAVDQNGNIVPAVPEPTPSPQQSLVKPLLIGSAVLLGGTIAYKKFSSGKK